MRREEHNRRRWPSLWSGFACLACLALIAGCKTTPGESVAAMAQPTTPVSKTVTNFENAKRCMDELFLEAGKRGIPITTGDISDETSSVKVSEQDMIINAIADMSRRSQAFEFFAVETQASAATELQQVFAPLDQVNTNLPSVYIRGSISQSDNNVTQDGQSGSVTLPFLSVGAGENQVAGTVSIDLQIVSILTRKVWSDATTSNTITIISDDDSQSARGLISQGSFGAAMSVSLSSARREGRGQAVRTLIEFSLIELLGKYTRVPYQRCLSLESNDPKVMRTALSLYEKLSDLERLQAVQAGLKNLGRYEGPIDGRMTPRLQDQISIAKDERGLLADGRVDFQIFNAFYEEILIPPEYLKSDQSAAIPGGRTPSQVPPSGRDPIGLSVALTQNILRVGDEIRVKASTETTARLYCYYEFVAEGTLQTVRIFPNRFQTNNLMTPHQVTVIPGPDIPVKLRLQTDEEEAISCVATTASYSQFDQPSVLTQGDLVPLACDYGGVACPVYEHQKVNALQTSTKHLRIKAVQ